MEANMGGTELESTLTSVLASRSATRPTSVFVLTDGEVRAALSHCCFPYIPAALERRLADVYGEDERSDRRRQCLRHVLAGLYARSWLWRVDHPVRGPRACGERAVPHDDAE